MNLGIIIQARMGSSRLPGKVLFPIAGKPLLGHVTGRLRHLQHNVTMVIATSTSAQDDIVADWCKTNGVECYRGDEHDVLNRYWCCTKSYGFDQIVRLTADNPFTDIEELGRLIDLHVNNDYDYTHAFGNLPLGVGAEIFTFSALQRSHAEGHAPNHREHVNEYIQENPALFNIGILEIPVEKRSPTLRLTVDTKTDWQRACFVADQAPNRWIGTAEAIELCSHFA